MFKALLYKFFRRRAETKVALPKLSDTTLTLKIKTAQTFVDALRKSIYGLSPGAVHNARNMAPVFTGLHMTLNKINDFYKMMLPQGTRSGEDAYKNFFMVAKDPNKPINWLYRPYLTEFENVKIFMSLYYDTAIGCRWAGKYEYHLEISVKGESVYNATGSMEDDSDARIRDDRFHSDIPIDQAGDIIVRYLRSIADELVSDMRLLTIQAIEIDKVKREKIEKLFAET